MRFMACTVRVFDINPTHRYKFFVWALILKRSDDGLVEKPKLIT